MPFWTSPRPRHGATQTTLWSAIPKTRRHPDHGLISNPQDTALCLVGLPSKSFQHASLPNGCSRKWAIYVGLVYGLIYASTDQYLPNLPEIEKALSTSQAWMTATVQINWVVKALFGLVSAAFGRPHWETTHLFAVHADAVHQQFLLCIGREVALVLRCPCSARSWGVF